VSNQRVRTGFQTTDDLGGTGGGATNLDGLSDVTITSPGTAQLLRYNGTQWVNYTLTGADLPNAVLTNPAAAQTITSGGTAVIPLAVRAASGQTANVLSGQNSDGTSSWYFDASGILWIRGTASTPPAVYLYPYTGAATFGFWNSAGSSVAEFVFDNVNNVFSMTAVVDVNIITTAQGLRVTTAGAVIVGNATANTGAWLLIRAGTATRAAINIPSGTAKTTPAVGDFEQIGGRLRFTGVVAQSGNLALNAEQTNNIAANTNNLAINRGTSLLRLNCTVASNLTGLTDGSAGRGVSVVNVGSATVTLTANDANSTAANQFAVAITLAAGATASLCYDSTSQRWRRIQ
jgi:hypothetical protein